MARNGESNVLTLLQPDLLTVEDLIYKIQSRCCRMQNLSVMSKERLVGLFRRVILPLPQRFYRTNRRGKMLTARRAKAGLEGRRKREREEAGCSSVEEEPRFRTSDLHDRLKPPPDVSSPHKIRIISHASSKKVGQTSEDSEKVDVDRGGENGGAKTWRSSPSAAKINAKRQLTDSEKLPSSTVGKKQRTVIKWP